MGKGSALPHVASVPDPPTFSLQALLPQIALRTQLLGSRKQTHSPEGPARDICHFKEGGALLQGGLPTSLLTLSWLKIIPGAKPSGWAVLYPGLNNCSVNARPKIGPSAIPSSVAANEDRGRNLLSLVQNKIMDLGTLKAGPPPLWGKELIVNGQGEG